MIEWNILEEKMVPHQDSLQNTGTASLGLPGSLL